MTVQELHIELDILLQRINSHYNQDLVPQEKDLFLNRAITRFVNTRLDRLSNYKGTGLFDTIKRTVELNPLLVTIPLPVLYNQESKEASVLLPFDFMYYVGSEASVCCSCKNLELVDKYVYESSILPIRTIDDLPLVITQGLFSVTITKDDIPSDYLLEGSIPFYTNEMMITNALQILLNKRLNINVEVKYDKVSNQFIFRSYSPFTVTLKNKTVLASNTTYKGYESFKEFLVSEVTVISEEHKRAIKSSYLSGAKDEKALAELREGKMVMTFSNVISDFVTLTYIRKPAKIDLLLQNNSELTDSTLEEIAVLAARVSLSVTASDNYSKFVQENTIIE